MLQKVTAEMIIEANGEEIDALQWFEPRSLNLLNNLIIPADVDGATVRSVFEATARSAEFVGASRQFRGQVEVISENANGRIVRLVPINNTQSFYYRELIRIFHPISFETLEIVPVKRVRESDLDTIRAIGADEAFKNGISLSAVNGAYGVKPPMP